MLWRIMQSTVDKLLETVTDGAENTIMKIPKVRITDFNMAVGMVQFPSIICIQRRDHHSFCLHVCVFFRGKRIKRANQSHTQVVMNLKPRNLLQLKGLE